MAKQKSFGSVGVSSSKIHIALPNSSAMLIDGGMGDLRIGFISGTYSKTINPSEPQETQFGVKQTETIEKHKIHWGSKTLPYNDTVKLEDIHNSEGAFIIDSMVVQFPYEEKTVVYGVPQMVQSISLHEFKKWPFKPQLFKQLFDRMPSHPLYQKIQREREKWAKRSGDTESLRRMRDTWLINRPPERIPYNIYKMWFGKGAMILPESSGEFVGRELGTEYSL